MRKLTIVLAAVALALAATGCNKLKSRSQVNEGVQAFKGAQYPQAVEHFKNAVDLDPTFLSARVYLATAYYQQYIPGADSPKKTSRWRRPPTSSFRRSWSRIPRTSWRLCPSPTCS